MASNDPRTVAAILHGVLVGPLVPPVAQRRTLTMPTLIIGHRNDKLHEHRDARSRLFQMFGRAGLYLAFPGELREDACQAFDGGTVTHPPDWVDEWHGLTSETMDDWLAKLSLGELRAIITEVVEHVEPERLDALARSVFGLAKPASVVVTTPNAEYNALYPALAAGAFRHPDHRFEWTRAEFAAWAGAVGGRYGYRVEFRAVGEADPLLGPPTQLALFRKEAAA